MAVGKIGWTLGLGLAIAATAIALPGQQVRSIHRWVDALTQPIPDNDRYHWVYVGLAKVKRNGFLVGLGGMPRRDADLDRLSAIRKYSQVFRNLESFSSVTTDVFYTSALLKPGTPEARDTEEELINGKRALQSGAKTSAAWVRRLSKEFPFEFWVATAIDSKQLEQRLGRAEYRIAHITIPKTGSALHPFADVPNTHWAAQATTDLRKLGLLRGYPDGTYRG